MHSNQLKLMRVSLAMAKKKNKQSQKKRQAKALKKRSQRNQVRKQNKLLKSKRKMPGMPGIPGGIPPEMQGMAQQMMEFSMPIMELANPGTPGEINALAALTQSFMGAFSEADLEKRAELLEKTRAAYESQEWATVPFDELAENLLKRHIHLLPKTHSEEERGRYSEAELLVAVETSFAADEAEAAPALPGMPQTPRIENLSEVVAGAISKETEAAVTRDDDKPTQPSAAPVSEQAFSPEKMDAEAALAMLDETSRNAFSTLGSELDTQHGEADFIDEKNPVLLKILDFQKQLVEIFGNYLESNAVPKRIVQAQKRVINSLLAFIKTYHQKSIFTTDADEVEEFLLDFYIRKDKRSGQTDKYAVNAIELFFVMAEKLGYAKNGGEIRERLAEIRDEFEELL